MKVKIIKYDNINNWYSELVGKNIDVDKIVEIATIKYFYINNKYIPISNTINHRKKILNFLLYGNK